MQSEGFILSKGFFTTLNQYLTDSKESLLKGRISRVNLLVPSSPDQLLSILKMYIQAIIMRRSTILCLPLK
jgi:hypothetical protein